MLQTSPHDNSSLHSPPNDLSPTDIAAMNRIRPAITQINTFTKDIRDIQQTLLSNVRQWYLIVIQIHEQTSSILSEQRISLDNPQIIPITIPNHPRQENNAQGGELNNVQYHKDLLDWDIEHAYYDIPYAWKPKNVIQWYLQLDEVKTKLIIVNESLMKLMFTFDSLQVNSDYVRQHRKIIVKNINILLDQIEKEKKFISIFVEILYPCYKFIRIIESAVELQLEHHKITQDDIIQWETELEFSRMQYEVISPRSGGPNVPSQPTISSTTGPMQSVPQQPQYQSVPQPQQQQQQQQQPQQPSTISLPQTVVAPPSISLPTPRSSHGEQSTNVSEPPTPQTPQTPAASSTPPHLSRRFYEHLPPLQPHWEYLQEPSRYILRAQLANVDISSISSQILTIPQQQQQQQQQQQPQQATGTQAPHYNLQFSALCLPSLDDEMTILTHVQSIIQQQEQQHGVQQIAQRNKQVSQLLTQGCEKKYGPVTYSIPVPREVDYKEIKMYYQNEWIVLILPKSQ